MRLLQRNSDGDFNLTEEIFKNIPPYAVLSHTWGKDGDEVTFKDIMSGIGESKPGYTKIQFCARQAANDGLKHFWVDTCCIDKSSSTELNEAINSMFRWYRMAAKCYVYLSDVSKSDGSSSRPRWKYEFQRSRWFTRGWTLQELVAPTSVEFFSREGARLGDKISMEQKIHEITGINVEALQGSDLSKFSFAERMSWAAERNTTREEDKAYSLLGICDIYMPLIYGEGKDKALERLQEQFEKPLKEKSKGAELIKVCQWLAPPDPYLNFEKALRERQDDTGLWFLESEQYKMWRTTSASFIWLYGIPGCGKTIICSTIIESVVQYCDLDSGGFIAYFYFDFRDPKKQIPGLMIRSLITQFSKHCTQVPTTLEVLYSSCATEQRQPTLHDLLEVLKQMIQDIPQAFVVLDALDECSNRTELMHTLKTVAGWHYENLHLLVTSRNERDIELTLEKLFENCSIICLESRLVDVDIRRYVHQRLSDDKDLKKWEKDPQIMNEIETVLMKGAQGMFRWAVCQLDALSECLTRRMLRDALADLPQTLDDTYERILCSIPQKYSGHAWCTLQWLAFSVEPLTVEEIAETVAIDMNRRFVFDPDEVLEDPLDVLKICSSLITITAIAEEFTLETLKLNRKVVLLAHYSVKEYLVSERSGKGPAAQYSMHAVDCNEFIAKSCLGYLLQFQAPNSLSNENIDEFKLVRYSAKSWITHTRAAAPESEALNRLVMELFSTGNGAYLNWAQLYDLDWPGYGIDFTRTLQTVPSPLYYASLSGLVEIGRLLILKGADVNLPGGRFDTALQAASAKGHYRIVELLLSKGANVHLRRVDSNNALQVATAEGHYKIVELLLSKGADVNLEGGNYNTALQAASAKGHYKIVELLLSKDANVNLQGGNHNNALQVASAQGHYKIVELLLSKGANINMQRGNDNNALQVATARGHFKIVELLLSKGADVNLQGGYYNTALQAASEHGNYKIVEILLSNGADINLQGNNFYNTALQAASGRGYSKIVELQLSWGADVNLKAGSLHNMYTTPLQAASAQGRYKIVELLLSNGADINVQGNNFYNTALHAASARGHCNVVKLLLSKGADVNLQAGSLYNMFNTPLQVASAQGHYDVVELLLSNGTDVNLQGGRYDTALQVASARGHYDVVALLLYNGADVNLQGGRHETALQAASAFDAALQAASVYGHSRVIQLLRSKGHSSRSAFEASSIQGQSTIVKLLLSKGAI